MGWIRRETEKGTTQYICPNCHDYHEFREDFGEQTFNENFVFCRRCGARNGTGTAPTLTPPNEPLTLEELREMGGQPYWHVGLREESPPPHWNILDPFYAKHIEDYRYGENWLAYRRPLEGEADA